MNGLGASAAAVGLLLALICAYFWRARAGRPMPAIRRLPGIEALEEAVGRATEMGRPVHVTAGIGDVRNPQTMASFPVLHHLARAAARYDTRLIDTSADIVVYAVNEEVVRQAYLEAGRPHAFRPDDVRFLSDSQFAYATGVMGLFRRERPAANIMYGFFGAEATMLIEAGAEVEAFQIGATTDAYQLPYFAAGCDYALIGEEMYAASAYLSRDPALIGTIAAQDVAKLLLIGLILGGILLTWLAGPANWLARALTG